MDIASTDHPLVYRQPSGIHGAGLCARRRIPPRRRIIEYVGRKITKSESLQLCIDSNAYIFTLDDEFDLDGSVEWNLARFINHSCAPNCSAEMTRGRIWIVSEQVIEAGQELTYDYGYDLDEYLNHPCQCGAPNCRGYIVSAEYAKDLQAGACPGCPDL